MWHRLLLACALLAACGNSPTGGDDDGIDTDAANGGIDGNPNCPAPATPPGGTCPTECTGGCQGTTCTIDCSGQNTPCADTDIVCPANFDCRVVCTGVDSCDTGTITCPPLYGCRVECSGGNDACGDRTVVCGAGPCSMDCQPDTCNGAEVDCSGSQCTATCNGSAPGDQPAVDCTGSCACTSCT
jgi:hypothetical protein